MKKKTKKVIKAKSKIKRGAKAKFRFQNIVLYFSIAKPFLPILTFFILGLVVGLSIFLFQPKPKVLVQENRHWLILHRKSQVEILYKGVPGDARKSYVVKAFKVKTGIPNERPTPLPELMGKDYFVIVKKYETTNDYETSPYFLELNVPHTDEPPYGPTNYPECEGGCNWQIPGPFGLHGVSGDLSRMDSTNFGSSGCIRHTDEDITYLYNELNLQEEVRYYIKDI